MLHRYWPPSVRSEALKLGISGKNVFISSRKSDEDGRLETVVNVVSNGGIRLVAFNREEFGVFYREMARIRSFCDLWTDKAIRVKDRGSLADHSKTMAPY